MKVGIVGSCISRDSFNQNFVPNYKYFYEVSCYQYQMSFISLMSKSIPYNKADLVGNAAKIDKEHLDSELAKPILDELVVNQPDYIIIDFYPDIMFGAVETKGSTITNKVFKWNKIKAIEGFQYGTTYNPRKSFDHFFEMWKEKFDEFMMFVYKHIPNTKVILNKGKLGKEYIDELNHEIKLIEPNRDQKEIDYLNNCWDKLDKYVEKVYGLESLDMNNKKYFCDPKHLWGKHPLHFKNNFYRDFLDKLLEISFKDLKENRPKFPVGDRRFNLIKNSTFEMDKSFWDKWNNQFKIVKNVEDLASVRIVSEDLENDRNFQIWSNDIEIHGNGEEDYVLSFEIKVDDIEQIDSKKMIFCVRTFNRAEHLTQGESVQHHNLNVDTEGFNITSNEWVRCTFKFKPKGRYIRVAPYLLRNGKVEWRKIQLVKTDKEGPWIPNIADREIIRPLKLVSELSK
ncbi:DUF6270 domain-containing protein [Alkalicoccobacillus gibsonii]|uniref:DUF6270 domain-containing protein n=1 Tax=Alkalicoccobacillus gibsonii TaxID=79881 RepID=UPI003F7C09E9